MPASETLRINITRLLRGCGSQLHAHLRKDRNTVIFFSKEKHVRKFGFTMKGSGVASPGLFSIPDTPSSNIK